MRDPRCEFTDRGQTTRREEPTAKGIDLTPIPKDDYCTDRIPVGVAGNRRRKRDGDRPPINALEDRFAIR